MVVVEDHQVIRCLSKLFLGKKSRNCPNCKEIFSNVEDVIDGKKCVHCGKLIEINVIYPVVFPALYTLVTWFLFEYLPFYLGGILLFFIFLYTAFYRKIAIHDSNTML